MESIWRSHVSAVFKDSVMDFSYIEQQFNHLPFLRLLLDINIADRVHNQDLAILGYNPLLRADGAGSQLCVHRRADALLLDALDRLWVLALLAHLTLLEALLLAVPLLGLLLLAGSAWSVVTGRARADGRAIDTRDARNAAEVVAPGQLARVLDVALDKLPVPLEAEV